MATRTLPNPRRLAGPRGLILGVVVVAVIAAAVAAIAAVISGGESQPAPASAAAVTARSGPAGVVTYEITGKGFREADLGSPASPHATTTWPGQAAPALRTSPDGRFVALVLNDEEGLTLEMAPLAGGLTTKVARLAEPGDPVMVQGKGEAAAVGGIPLVTAFSPDSTRIAFGTLRLPYALTIATRQPNGTWETTDYPVSGGYVGELAWSPDGTKLAISTYALDRKDHTMLILGAGEVTPRHLIDGCHVVWSPDSRYIAIHRDPGAETGAWAVPVERPSAREAITTDPAAFPVAWRVS